MDNLFFVGVLLLFVLFAPWILLWKSRSRQKQERAEDLDQIERLKSRTFELESSVRELKRSFQAPAAQPPPQPPAEVSTVTPRPIEKAPEPEPTSGRIAAEAWISQKVSRPAPHIEPEHVVATNPVMQVPPVEPTRAPSSSVSFESSSYVAQNTKSALDLEEMLGTNWLNKIGISILVLGIAFFLAYQIRTLGPAGKVLVGYLVAASMLGVGIWFERHERYRILARAGVGGGWALFFFVTYAMYHITAAQVISSEVTDLALMLGVAAAMVWHSLRFRSQVVTSLAFLLAFVTVTISQDTVYSLTAGVVLAAGLAVVVGKMQWFELEIFGIAASYFNHYLWLRHLIEPMGGKHHMFPEFLPSAAILVTYWIIFRISYVWRSPTGPKQENISAAAALLNAGSLLGLLKYQSVHPEWAFWALLAMGAVEIALGQLPITRRRRTAVIMLSTLGAVLLVAAFPFRYSGARLSILWLAEAEALFLVGVWVGEIVFRRIGMLALAAVAGQMISVDAARIFGMRSDDAYVHSDFGLGTLFLVATIVFYLNSHWVLPRWQGLFANKFDKTFVQRFSYAASLLLWIGVWIAFPEAWTAVEWSVVGVALALAASRLKIPELGYQGKLMMLAAVIRVLVINLDATEQFHGLTFRLITVLIVSALLYFGSRFKVEDEGNTLTIAGLTYSYSDIVAGMCTWAASFLLSLLAWYELRSIGVAVAWAIGGVLLLEIGTTYRSVSLRQQAYVAFISSFARIFFVNLNASGVPGEISPRFYTVVPIAMAFFYTYWRLQFGTEEIPHHERTRAAPLSCYLGTISIAALMRFELEADWVVAAWAGLVFALCALAWWSGRRIFLHQGLLLSFGVLFRAVLHNFYERSYFQAPLWYDRRLCVGVAIAMLLASLLFAFRLRNKETSNESGMVLLLQSISRRPEQVFFFIAVGLLTVLLTLETRHGMITLAWGIEALCVFMFALLVSERSFRLTGVTLLLLCVGKILLVDVWRLQPRDRYITLIVLGAALLWVSFMYTRYREAIREYL
jgi:uncharacterized membrane protein